MPEIGQSETQIPAPATDTPAPHGGSLLSPEAFNAAYRAGHAVLVDGTVEPRQREGHGQDPAQDGAQTASLVRAAAPRLHERLAAEALAADRVVVSLAPAQPAGGASGGHSLLNEREMGVLEDFLNDHRDDIEHGINDFGDLRPLLPWLDGKWPR